LGLAQIMIRDPIISRSQVAATRVEIKIMDFYGEVVPKKLKHRFYSQEGTLKKSGISLENYFWGETLTGSITVIEVMPHA